MAYDEICDGERHCCPEGGESGECGNEPIFYWSSILGPSASVQYDCRPEGGAFAPAAGQDMDFDGLKDYCETVYAQAFEPELLFHHDEIYEEREPHFIVTTKEDGLIYIGYLLSYYYDGEEVSHNGDSEFIILAVRPGPMAVQYVTLSAHWGASFGWISDETTTVNGNEMSYTGARPRVWVSRSHHANYQRKVRCDYRWWDFCSEADYAYIEPAGMIWCCGIGTGLRPDNNIGSATYPFDIHPWGGVAPDCTLSETEWLGMNTGYECFFTKPEWNSKFAGWQGSGGTTHYRDALSAFGLM